MVWNMVTDSLLIQFPNTGPIRAIGYADDVLLVGQGIDPNTITSNMQRAIDRARAWAEENGLKFNPVKTDCCHFNPHRHVPDWPTLRMGDTNLNYTNTVKYLGLIIDHKLNWGAHIRDKCLKAKRLLNMAKQAVGREWGLSPDKLMWILKAVIRPQISYGSVVWAHRIRTTLRRKLDSVQRQILIRLSHSMRSTPTAGIEAVVGLPPLYLHCQEMALNTAFRLHTKQKWRKTHNPKSQRDWGLGIISSEIPGQVRLPPPTFKVNRLKAPQSLINPTYTVYTDGSKDESGTGYGWCVTRGDQVVYEESRPLDSSSSVFMAEMMALIDSLHYLK